MLVLISDLHLTDGSSGSSIPQGAFSLFADRLREMASAASWRGDGEYRPIQRIDVVLLGDVLDCIRSSRWLSSEARPWGDPHSPAYLSTISQIVADILRHNSEGLAILRELSAGINIPPVNRWGQAVPDAVAARAEVRLHYMVGNHDWFLHLPGQDYQRIRQTIVQQLGLATPAEQPFPHDPAESEMLLDTMRRHKLLARHGDIFDPINFAGDRNASSIGDAVVIELVNHFADEVQKRLADRLPAATLAGLREIDNIRPTLLVPVWIGGLLERTCPALALRKQVKLTWDTLVDRFLQLDFVRSHGADNSAASIDGLERILKFSKRLSIGWASAIADWLEQLRGAADPSYYKHALAEADFRNRRARHIVYGHTHVAEIVPLDASYAEGFVLDQVYFNSGTWRRLHRPTRLAPAQHEFIASDAMTYLAFYQGDERQGRAYETWTGTLGPQSAALTIHRIDPAANCVEESAPSAAPHFASGAIPTAATSAGARGPIISIRRR